MLIKIATQNNLEDSIPIANISMGVTHWYLMNFDSARYYYNTALDKAKELNQTKNIAHCYHNLGLTEFKQSKPNEALAYYRKSLTLYTEIKHEARIAKLQLDMGGAFMLRTSLDSSVYYYHLASKYFEEKNDKLMLIFLYNGMGNLNFDIGNFKLAKSYYLKSIALDKEVESVDIMYSNYNNLGRYYEKIPGRKLDSALYFYEESLRAINYDQSNDSYLSTNINIGIVYYLKKDYRKALEYNRNVLNIPKIKEFKLEYASVLANMGIYYIKLAEYDSTEYYFDIVLPMAQKNNFLTVEDNIYNNRADMYSIIGDYENALYEHLKSDSIKNIIMDNEREQEIRILENEIRNNATSRENELLKKQNHLGDEIIKKSKYINYSLGVVGVLSLCLIIVIGLSRRRLIGLNEDLKEKKETLEELNLTKDKLFSIVSHDLRGPVGSTYKLLELLNKNFETDG